MTGRVLVTGGSGVLGRAVVPRLRRLGHAVDAPARHEVDLLDPAAVRGAVGGADAVLHLASRIPPPERAADPGAWAHNDALRRDATRLLAEACRRERAGVLVLPTVAWIPDEGPVPPVLRSAVDGERAVLALAGTATRGVVLRLGLLYGPGAWTAEPDGRRGATLHVEDAGEALVRALDAPAGVHVVVDPDPAAWRRPAPPPRAAGAAGARP